MTDVSESMSHKYTQVHINLLAKMAALEFSNDRCDAYCFEGNEKKRKRCGLRQMHLFNIYMWIFLTLLEPACSVTMTAAAIPPLTTSPLPPALSPIQSTKIASQHLHMTIAVVGRV